VIHQDALADSLEKEVLQSIREQLSSPSWKEEVWGTLKGMVNEEFGDGAESRAEELQRQLEVVHRQILCYHVRQDYEFERSPFRW
jgi:hypothetical protein